MQMEQIKHRQQTSHRKYRRPKIVSFSMTNITGHGYYIQHTTEIMKLRMQTERTRHK